MPNIRLFWVASFLSLFLTACGGGSTLESGGNTTTGSNGSISLALSSPDGEDGVNSSKTSPITATATVRNSKGSSANLLVTFVLSNDVGELSPAVGTAVTDSSGKATLFINPSEINGAGSVSANVSLSGESISSNPIGYSFSGGSDSTASLSVDAKLYTCDETWSGTATRLDGCTRTTQILADGTSQLIIALTQNGQAVTERLISTGTENGDIAITDFGEKLTDSNGIAIFTLYPSSELEESLDNIDLLINVDNETLDTIVVDARPMNLSIASSIYRCPSSWVRSNDIENCIATSHIIAGEPEKYVFATYVGDIRTKTPISGYSVTVLSSLIDIDDSHLLTDGNGLAWIELDVEPATAEDSIRVLYEGENGGTQLIGYTATVLTDGSGGVVNDDLKLTLSLSSSSLTTSSNITATATLSNGSLEEISGKVITFSLDETSLGSFAGNSKAVTDDKGVAKLELSSSNLDGSGLITATFGEASDSKAFTSTGQSDNTIAELSLRLTDTRGNNVTQVSDDSPGVIVITLTSPGKTVANQLIEVTTSVGVFQNGSSAVLTDGNGRATLVIEAGTVKNAGTITATYGTDVTQSINFSSEGDQVATTNSEFDLSVSLYQGTSSNEINTISNAAPGRAEVILTDASGEAVANKVVTFSSTLGNVFPETALTSANGRASVELTAGTTKGAGTLTAVSSGATAVIGFSTEGDENLQVEGLDIEVELYDCSATNAEPLNGTCSTTNNISLTKPGTIVVTVTRQNSTTPVEGAIINLTTDAGIFSPENGRVLTNASGMAAISLLAGDSQGAGTVTASATGSLSVTQNFEIGAANIAMGFGSTTSFIEGTIGNDLSGGSLSAGSTTLLTINLVDQNNANALYTDPVVVTFSSLCASETPAKASIDTQVTAINGIAQATYRADGCQGIDRITATASAGSLSLNATATIAIADVAATSVEFVQISVGDDTDARIITFPGTGRTEKADVQYRVLDENNNPAAGETVYFSLSTSVGGLSISPTEAKTDNNGLVTVSVQSGSVPTPVRVLADLMTADGAWNAAEVFVDANTNNTYDSGESFTDTNGNGRWDDAESFTDADGDNTFDSGEAFEDEVNTFNNPRIQAVSDVLTVSTGLADQNSFSLATATFNPEAWRINNNTDVLTVNLSDHFNNPVPDNTAVQFVTEGGSIEPSCTTVNGKCSVTWTSSNPRPAGNNLDNGGQVCDTSSNTGIADFAPAGKPCVFNGVAYPIAQPRAGRATVIAYAVGEESFTDSNADGLYTAGESFGDLDEAFLDHNNDGLFCGKLEDGSDAPGAETAGCQAGGDGDEFIDFNSNQSFDQSNGVYNGLLCTAADEASGDCTKGLINVRKSNVIVMSGSFARFYWVNVDTGAEAIEYDVDGTAKTALVYITDLNNNPMPAGSTVTFSTSNGKLTGTTQFEFQNTTDLIPQGFSITVSDDTPTGINEITSGLLQVLVETPAGNKTVSNITVND